jgi:5-methylcytosine-specific restriction endonuclease McrA
LACAVCNNAKSDKFTYEEFKRVGNVIKQIWAKGKPNHANPPKRVA